MKREKCHQKAILRDCGRLAWLASGTDWKREAVTADHTGNQVVSQRAEAWGQISSVWRSMWCFVDRLTVHPLPKKQTTNFYSLKLFSAYCLCNSHCGKTEKEPWRVYFLTYMFANEEGWGKPGWSWASYLLTQKCPSSCLPQDPPLVEHRQQPSEDQYWLEDA